jgi:hypothetical protein
MASGTITLINDTNMKVSYNIAANGATTQSGVASGIIGPSGTDNVQVSGYDLYQVNFGADGPEPWNAQQVNAGSQVVFSVSSVTSGTITGD